MILFLILTTDDKHYYKTILTENWINAIFMSIYKMSHYQQSVFSNTGIKIRSRLLAKTQKTNFYEDE